MIERDFDGGSPLSLCHHNRVRLCVSFALKSSDRPRRRPFLVCCHEIAHENRYVVESPQKCVVALPVLLRDSLLEVLGFTCHAGKRSGLGAALTRRNVEVGPNRRGLAT